MAKGKKNVLRTNKKKEDSKEKIVTSQTETKENKPASNKQTCKDKIQTYFQNLRSPSKPRSPLSDSSSKLIQEDNDSETTDPEMARLKEEAESKIKDDGCESIEKKPDEPGQSCGAKEQTNDDLEKKESPKQAVGKSPTDGKVSESGHQIKASRKHRAKKVEKKVSQNKKVTDYFPIRRSNRKTKGEIKSEEHRQIDDLINKNTEEGMEVRQIEGKGRGVFAVRAFKKGDFVVEYHGDLLDLAEAKTREDQYAQDPQTGCYMYYFQYQSKSYCIDATKESGRLGRLVNHSKSGNCQTRLHAIGETPHLILVASRDIKAGEELLYDYGDRSKESITAHPWLKF
ncbi:N-lysine methyltransferase KMT5A isoform X3 [Oryzias latipes]|uniref:[histone H4]-lysine(20) N-methyltransferase n=1 Tax=Oryzias latipes TaxID=8090 RepID=A0A3B3HFJ9_ORYLA|nr:N-lysine methyltransferase KMT5A isoform X3 [Oryzias latipes]